MKISKLIILYSKGGLGDVGRHAVRVALDRGGDGDMIQEVTVLSQHAETLEESNWNCGCTTPHSFTDDERKRLNIVKVDSWEDESLIHHFQGAGAVISCLGNRQMTLGDRVGGIGSRMVVKAMNKYNITRAVVISSVGVGNDWPPIEWHWSGTVLKCIFLTIGRKDYKDLTAAEEAYTSSKDVDYLFIRPVGVSEDFIPQNKWVVQKEKFKDKSLHFEVAKLDCARFMVEEAVAPTRHKTGVVVGSPKSETK